MFQNRDEKKKIIGIKVFYGRILLDQQCWYPIPKTIKQRHEVKLYQPVTIHAKAQKNNADLDGDVFLCHVVV